MDLVEGSLCWVGLLLLLFCFAVAILILPTVVLQYCSWLLDIVGVIFFHEEEVEDSEGSQERSRRKRPRADSSAEVLPKEHEP
jgi:hypothetical protein